MIPGKYTLSLLADIENRIDPETEEDYLSQWRNFLSGGFHGDIFIPERRVTSAPGIEIKNTSVNSALENHEMMLDSQLESISAALSGNGALAVRANYGTGIMPSLFGADIFVMPDSANTLPTAKKMGGDCIGYLLEKGIPSHYAGLGRKVFDTGEIYRDVFHNYPKIEKYVRIYHPDTQGPLDIAELIWGSDIFYAMYDEPELLKAFLSLITESYKMFLDKWFELYPPDSDINTHWSVFHKGTVMLRDDSAMNLSPEFYEEYSLPYDAEILRYFKGGALHFCGRGDHYINAASSIPGLYCVNLSQPHLNDMEVIYRSTVDKGIFLLDMPRERAVSDSARGFGGRLHSNRY